MYGKINNGIMIKAPSILKSRGRTYINPPSTILQHEGYIKLTFNPAPSAEQGYTYVQNWTDQGVQEWILQQDLSESAQSKKRFNEIEDAIIQIADLTDENDTTTASRLDQIDQALVELAEIISSNNQEEYE